MKKVFLVAILIFCFGCSKNDSETVDTNPISEEEPEIVLDLVATETLGTTPFSKAWQYIVHEDILYVVDDTNTYSFDLITKQWETISDLQVEVTNFAPFLSSISFIREGKWCLFSSRGLWEFDFDLNMWNEIPVFSPDTFFNPKGFYVDNLLHFVSNANGNDKIYTYDFATNSVSEQGTFEMSGNRGEITQPVFKVGNDYFTVLYTDGFAVYKYGENFKTMELINKYNAFPLSNCSAFLFEDKLVFGLAGSATVDLDGNYLSSNISDALYYYDIEKNEFGQLPSPFSEARYGALPFAYGNEYFLMGGTTVIEEKIVTRTSIEKLTFEYVTQK